MILPPDFEWVYPGSSAVAHVRRAGGWRTLCGDRVKTGKRVPGFCPAEQPVDPQPRCERCVEELEKLG